MHPLLHACRAKLDASVGHLNRLNESAERLFEGKVQVFDVRGELNPQRTKYLFRINEVPEFPRLEWGVMIGDAIHCLRSALDHLIHGLAREPSRETQFPIFRKRRDWVVKGPAMYWSVPDLAVAIIDEAQPYKRGDSAAEHPLAVLAALSNLDKHRTIPATALVPDDQQPVVHSVQGIREWSAITFHAGRPLEKDAVFAQAAIVAEDGSLEPQMNVDFFAAIEVGFGEIKSAPVISYKPVIATIREVIGAYAVDEVLNRITDAHVAEIVAGRDGLFPPPAHGSGTASPSKG